MIEYSKLQIGCMLIVIYIAFIYFRERYAYKVKKKEIVFEFLLFTGIFSIECYAIGTMLLDYREWKWAGL